MNRISRRPKPWRRKIKSGTQEKIRYRTVVKEVKKFKQINVHRWRPEAARGFFFRFFLLWQEENWRLWPRQRRRNIALSERREKDQRFFSRNWGKLKRELWEWFCLQEGWVSSRYGELDTQCDSVVVRAW